jgi:hypothetical protein
VEFETNGGLRGGEELELNGGGEDGNGEGGEFEVACGGEDGIGVGGESPLVEGDSEADESSLTTNDSSPTGTGGKEPEPEVEFVLTGKGSNSFDEEPGGDSPTEFDIFLIFLLIMNFSSLSLYIYNFLFSPRFPNGILGFSQMLSQNIPPMVIKQVLSCY